MVGAVFDTNILIDYLAGVRQARDQLALFNRPAISIITWAEVMVGANAEIEAGTRGFLKRFAILEIDQAVAERAVTLRRAHRVKLPDALIWATAEVHGMLLVTRNTKDFPPDDPGIRMPYELR